MLMRRGCTNSLVTVLGMTFKENVPDIRNSKVIDILRELDRFGVRYQVHDPMASADEVDHEYGVSLTATADLKPADAVIFAVSHREYCDEGWPLMTRLLKDGAGPVLDVKSKLDRATRPDSIELWRL